MKALIILYGEKAVTMSSMYMLKMGLVWKWGQRKHSVKSCFVTRI
jgi:hypothetical protein